MTGENEYRSENLNPSSNSKVCSVFAVLKPLKFGVLKSRLWSHSIVHRYTFQMWNMQKIYKNAARLTKRRKSSPTTSLEHIFLYILHIRCSEGFALCDGVTPQIIQGPELDRLQSRLQKWNISGWTEIFAVQFIETCT